MKYYDNPRHNRAANVLAFTSPGLIQDIADLLSARGTSVAKTVFSRTDLGISPLAILDDTYVDDRDVDNLATGLATICVASLRSMTGNAESYAKILSQAFSLPEDWAKKLGARIDESSVSFVPSAADKAGVQSFIDKTMNKIGNLAGGMKNIKDYLESISDVDFLYELSLLGKQVAELTTMQRLMRSKSLIDAAMDVLPSSAHMGDPLAGDGHMVEQYANIVQPLQGNILPAKILGGAGKLSLLGQLAGVLGLKKWASSISHSGDSKDGLNVARKAETGPNGSLVSYLAQIGLTSDQLSKVKEIVSGAAAGSIAANGDLTAIGDIYGDATADFVRNGDLPGAIAHLRSVADAADGDPSEEYPGQGDIIDGQLDQVFASGSEDGQNLDAEMGGLFRKSAKKQQKRTARIARRQAQRQAKQEARDIDARTANEERLAQSQLVRSSASRVSPFAPRPYLSTPQPVPYSMPVSRDNTSQWPGPDSYVPGPSPAVAVDPATQPSFYPGAMYPLPPDEQMSFDPWEATSFSNYDQQLNYDQQFPDEYWQ